MLFITYGGAQPLAKLSLGNNELGSFFSLKHDITDIENLNRGKLTSHTQIKHYWSKCTKTVSHYLKDY